MGHLKEKVNRTNRIYPNPILSNIPNNKNNVDQSIGIQSIGMYSI